MLCNNCGHEADNTNIFCSNCGQKRQEDTPELVVYQPGSPPLPQPPAHPYAFPPNPWQHAPGKNYLLVSGIFLIIFGVFGTLISLTGIALSFHLNLLMPVWGWSWSMYYTVTLIAGIFSIFVGIMGVANRARPGRASLCMILAVIYIAVSVIVAVFASAVFLSGSFALFVIISLAADIILPVVYFIGGKKNAAVAYAPQQYY